MLDAEPDVVSGLQLVTYHHIQAREYHTQVVWNSLPSSLFIKLSLSYSQLD